MDKGRLLYLMGLLPRQDNVPEDSIFFPKEKHFSLLFFFPFIIVFLILSL